MLASAFILAMAGLGLPLGAAVPELVKDIRSGSGSSWPEDLVNVNGTLFFRGYDGVNGFELWKSDGTAAGTVMVKDICSGSGSSIPRYFVNVNGTLFFSAHDGVNGYELWKSDGTAAGTVMVKDIYSGSVGSDPAYLVNVNGTLFFQATDGVNGYELWKSDGTAAGTVLVKDIYSGSVGSIPYNLVNVNGTLFFAATDGVNGTELWKSDGTEAGTVMVADITGDSGNSSPLYLTVAGDWLFFAATRGDVGTELFRYPLAAGAPEIAVLGNGVEIADGDATPSATDHTDFGSVLVSGGNLTRTFTITNSGTVVLNVTAINLSGAQSADFSVGGITLPATVNAGASTTFTVTFDPSDAGLRSATVTVANNDGDEGSYDFAIQGTGRAAPAVVYVDDDYTSGSCGGHEWGYDAFATVADGLAAVAAGGTLTVAAGDYATENVVIDSAVVFAGESATVASITLNSGADVSGAALPGAATVNVNAGAKIQQGVNLVSAGGTVTVGAGTYLENVTIAKNLKLVSVGGKAVTTIQGSDTGVPGTLYLPGPTTGVQIGDLGHGFKIVGFDTLNPALEMAALYVRGGNDNLVILDCEIEAAGEAGLLTEWGAAINGLTVGSCVFSGKTFVGANPAGQGFAQQFELWNVPRQLIAISGGSSGATRSVQNVVFTNNVITGVAGGLNDLGQEQGNSLATIDAQTVTVSGNSFAGETMYYGAALRVRGLSTAVTGNSFDDSRMGANTALIYAPATALAPATLYDVLGANTVTAGIWVGVNGMNVVQVANLQEAINNLPLGVTINVGAGIYAENLNLNRGVRLQGAYTVNGTLVVQTAGILSPGQSPGTVSAGNTTWGPGGVMDWQINQADGTAGADPGWDLLNITGTLDITATAGSPFVLNLQSLTLANASGEMANFNNAQAYTWKVATASGGVTGFDAAKFTVNAAGIANALGGGQFVVTQAGNDVNVVFLPGAGSMASIYVDDNYAGLPNGTVVKFPAGGSGADHLIGADAFATVQAGINAVAAGGTVNVAAGSYAENVTVNKRLSLVGAGSGSTAADTILAGDAAGDYKIGVVNLSGSGVSAAEPLLIKDVRISAVGRSGISVGRFTEETGTSVDYLKLENVKVVGSNTNPCTEQERGLYVDLTSSLTHLVATNCAFDNLAYGWYIQKKPILADLSTVKFVEVSGSTFNHNNIKGIYAEKLSDATFTNCVFSQNGYDASLLAACSYFAPWLAGVDLNLKAGDYGNLAFIGCAITDNATGGAREGVGMTIKGRGTGSDGSYAANPSTVTGVLIDGCTITGNERGVRFGEPGKANTTPTGVVVTNSVLSGNTQHYVGVDGSAYGDAVNQTTATPDLSGNYWGQADPLPGQVSGSFTRTSYYADAGLTQMRYAQVYVDDDYTAATPGWGQTHFATVAGGAVAVAAGGTLTVAAGDYATENVVIDSAVVFAGESATVASITLNSGADVSGAALPGAATVNVNAGAKIQQGVNLVSAGGTVNVGAGNYTERLNLTKAVNLIGAQAGVNPVPEGARVNPAVESVITEAGLSTPNPDVLIEIANSANNVVINGFTLNGDPSNTTADTSTIRCWATGVTVSHNIMDGMNVVIFKGGSDFTLATNRIVANKAGFVAQPGASTNVNVLGNSFAMGGNPQADPSAINLTAVNGGVVSGNLATGFVVGTAGRALAGSGISNLLVSANVFLGNRDGISIFGGSSFLTVSDNVLANSGRFGLNIKAADTVITGNLFTNNATAGLNLDRHLIDSARMTVSTNIISGSPVGVIIIGIGTEVALLGNNLAGNTASLSLLSGSLTATAGNAVTGQTITVAGALFTLNDDSFAANPFILNSGGILKGLGTVGDLAINNGGRVRPGTSPGTISVATNVTFAGGGNYDWEINKADGTAGADPGWDFLNISGALNITATSGSKFNVNLATLTLANAVGEMANFNNTLAYAWAIATASGGITGFDAAAFNLNTAGFANATAGGSFGIITNNNTLYVTFIPAAGTISAIYVDDNYAGLPNGTVVKFPAGGSGADHMIGADAFATVQAGINAVASNGVVNVAAGVYHEQVVINQPLALEGADGAVLDGTGLVGPWTTGIKIRSGNVTINNMDVAHYTQDGITAYKNINMPNLRITNCRIADIQPGYWGFGIYIGYEAEGFGYTPPHLTNHLDFSGLVIANNEITNTACSGVVLQSITASSGLLVVSNNLIHGITNNDAIWIDCARKVAIENNVIEDNLWGIDFTAIAEPWFTLDGPYGAQDILVRGNVIQNNEEEGIAFYNGWPATVTVENNIIAGNGTGAANFLSEPFNASGNWWGTNTSGGVAASISGPVDYTPFLDNGTDTDPGTPGFQGDFRILHVDYSSPQTGGVDPAQEAANLLAAYTPPGTPLRLLIEVNGGTLTLADNSYQYSDVVVTNGGVLTGVGAVGNLWVMNAGLLQPGTSPGAIYVATNVTWGAGGSYDWEITNAIGTAGAQWDLLHITNTLTITATAGSEFNVNLLSLLADNTPGAVAGFNNAQNYTWVIAKAGSVVGFDATDFILDASGFANPLMGGFFSIALQGGTDVVVTFTSNAPPVGAIADVNVLEDAPNTVIDLTAAYADDLTPDTSLVYTVQGNTNAALVSAIITDSTNLTLAYAANGNGTSEITVRATDAGGRSTDVTFLVTVTAVNDAPVVTLASNVVVLEDAGTVSLSSFAAFSPGLPANESGQSLVGHVLANNNNGLFSVQPAINNSGTLTFTPVLNANGSATVTVVSQDDGGTANGGIDKTTNSFTITVQEVNDPPIAGADVVAGPTPEDTAMSFASAPFLANDVVGPITATDEAGQTLKVIGVLPRSLKGGTVALSATNGTITYLPATNFNGVDTLYYVVQDNGTTAGAPDWKSAIGEITVTVTPTPTIPGTGSPQDDVRPYTFGGVSNLLAGPGPNSVALGDFFDGDGVLDLAVANYNSNTVTLLLNDGYGNFTPMATLTVPTNPAAVAVADFNNDTLPDLAVASDTANKVTVFTNDFGAFVESGSYAVGSNAIHLAVGLLDAGLWPDVAVVSYVENKVDVLLNNGDGTLAAPVSYPAGSNPVYVAIGLLGGSPRLDLAVVNRGDDTVSVLTNNGSGGFALATNIGVGQQPAGVALGNYDGVAGTDLLVANQGSHTLSVLRKAGANWNLTTNYFVGNSPSAVLLGDYNGDNKLDAVVANEGDDTVWVLFGAGNGTFTNYYVEPATAYQVGDQPVALAMGDLNPAAEPSGRSDLVVANYGSGDVSILLNTTLLQAFGQNVTVLEDAAPTNITLRAWGAPITYSIAVDPVMGDVTGTPPDIAYEPWPDWNGSDRIGFRVTDGVRTVTNWVNITIIPVNDPPGFEFVQSVLEVGEDCGRKSFYKVATNLFVGPWNEKGQVFRFLTSNNTNGLWTVQPALSSSTILTFQPKANAFGTSVVTVVMQDAGGTAYGGIDLSPPRSLELRVTNINDAPLLSRTVAGKVIYEDGSTNFVIGIDDLETPLDDLVVTVSSTNTALVDTGEVSWSRAGTNWTFVVTPKANQHGRTLLTFTVADAHGGVTVRKALLTVVKVNDQPSFSLVTNRVDWAYNGGGYTNQIVAAASAGPNEAEQRLYYSVVNTNVALFSVTPRIAADGVMVFKPRGTVTGNVTLDVYVKDTGGGTNYTFGPLKLEINLTP